LAGKKISQPTYFIAGKNDPITHMVRKAIKRLPTVVEDLRGVEFFEDCGHWISCEQTELLNKKILKS
jgi:pimeloyl-ACP methyl ester carboxylesterase